MVDDRWVEVTPSQFPHEAEGLRILRNLLPDRAPFRAWSNFEFRDDRGNWSEVDLLLLASDGLHLVELKYYSGRLRGTDQTWLRDGHGAEDSPLLLANRKAKRLRSKLMNAYTEWARSLPYDRERPSAKDAIPYVQESVFLHHPDFVCELPESLRRGLYGLPGNEQRSGLAPINELFTGTPRPGTRIYEKGVAGIMGLIGVRGHRREAGSYVLESAPLEDGPGWQDWIGTHKLLQTKRRIRFRIVPAGSPEEARRRVRLIATHEMRVMQHLSHDAILRPEDYVDSELGPGLVYPYDPAWQRLDLWLAGKPTGFDFDAQLDLIRRIGEALQYAHGKNVVHRGLSPRAVLVRPDRDGRLQVRLTDWQGVGRTDEATATTATRGVTMLADALAGEIPHTERWVRDGFTAPEGTNVGAPDRLRLDVFGLGALAFYLVTGGQPPARTRADLTARLRVQGGLDVSVELPEVPPALREAVLAATRPRVSERLPDVGALLAALDHVASPTPEEITDPLDAGPGALLGERFALVSRLGAGSTAVGLLVDDLAHADGQHRVLKVALDDAAGRRLEDEAEALRQLASPRIVKLLEGPIVVGGRSALLLANAGRETLATHLGNRERLSLDLLERWGTDLLETVLSLDEAGISHRDIKPANLGIREDRGNRAKHLVLFDFSLTKAAASDTQAGTRPYLDPFLSGRRQYDSAAERYAAAVVLFEMATGHTPVYGDGLSDPAAIDDAATLDPEEFDPSARARLVEFFTTALARDARARHDTAAQMLQQWRACFPESSALPENADELAADATADTPLMEAGLTPRAISALEQLHVVTVGDLAAVDSVRLNHLAGVAAGTRQEIKARAKLWRNKYKGRGQRWVPDRQQTALPEPADCADILLEAARRTKADRAVIVAAHLLGTLGTLDPNATQSQLAASLKPPITRGRVSQLLGSLQDRWAADPSALGLLTALSESVDDRLAELGGVATFDELARHLLSLMVARPDAADATHTRLAQGLLRCTIDRQAALERAEGPGDQAEGGWLLRRREARPMLVATRHDLLDVAEALGRRADELVDEANLTGTDKVVPAPRAAQQLAAVLDEAQAAAPARAVALYDGLREGRRLAWLAARLSDHTGGSATGELHHRELSAVTALRLTLPVVAAGHSYPAQELRERVQARFPDVADLPTRPELDTIVAQAVPTLHWDERAHTFRAPEQAADHTTGLDSRPPTVISPSALGAGPGAVGQRLADSRERRSFVAFGVGALYLEKFTELLRTAHDVVEVDLTHELMDGLHATAQALNVPWSTVLEADADAPGSRADQGLRALVTRSLPIVREAIERALARAEGRPVVLTDASLLARYDALDVLAPWMDLATARPAAVWLVVPQLHGNLGPMVDGRSLPLTAPSQYVPVPPDWIATQHRSLAAEGSTA